MANFTNNTTQLQNLLEKVNALPEAGSGGGSSGGGDAGMCTVEFLANAPAPSSTVHYLNSEGEECLLDITSQMWMMGFTITVPAKTPIYFDNHIGMVDITGGVVRIGYQCFYVTGNATVMTI